MYFLLAVTAVRGNTKSDGSTWRLLGRWALTTGATVAEVMAVVRDTIAVGMAMEEVIADAGDMADIIRRMVTVMGDTVATVMEDMATENVAGVATVDIKTGKMCTVVVRVNHSSNNRDVGTQDHGAAVTALK